VGQLIAGAILLLWTSGGPVLNADSLCLMMRAILQRANTRRREPTRKQLTYSI